DSPRYEEIGQLRAWHYTRFKKTDGSVDMTISILPQSPEPYGNTRLCVRSIGTLNSSASYEAFRGRMPTVDALLRNRGLSDASDCDADGKAAREAGSPFSWTASGRGPLGGKFLCLPQY